MPLSANVVNATHSVRVCGRWITHSFHHTCIYIYTRIHTHIHTYIHTYIHAYIHTYMSCVVSAIHITYPFVPQVSDMHLRLRGRRQDQGSSLWAFLPHWSVWPSHWISLKQHHFAFLMKHIVCPRSQNALINGCSKIILVPVRLLGLCFFCRSTFNWLGRR